MAAFHVLNVSNMSQKLVWINKKIFIWRKKLETVKHKNEEEQSSYLASTCSTCLKKTAQQIQG